MCVCHIIKYESMLIALLCCAAGCADVLLCYCAVLLCCAAVLRCAMLCFAVLTPAEKVWLIFGPVPPLWACSTSLGLFHIFGPASFLAVLASLGSPLRGATFKERGNA